ncbi:hypothetical protein LOK49_LG02G01377 [Camellia lanceoleosa]|uniref:Uncharacterized protein n=1 Tax=Camellia lanceoleosa TaxID=1840588 RepID=A0ACC0IK51_9ERIC|nr:hypothetical protein LOK49_LG02G01377 [Camellia lanceoleosa]
MSVRRDKTIEEQTIAPEIGNEYADPASIDGDGAGATSNSCADPITETNATTTKIVKALNELNLAIADRRMDLRRARGSPKMMGLGGGGFAGKYGFGERGDRGGQ